LAYSTVQVILLYEESFWDENRDMFGFLNEPEKLGSLDPKDYENKRGRFYLIWNASKTSGRPMLIALMAGHAAYDAEYTSTEALMDEVTERLRGVFGPKVPKPIEVIVTRWRRDRFTRGTYSYVARDTLPSDYDTMARPVGNLHFAGEATCGTHPATVHGALLSGLRVASDVVEAMIGPIDVPEPIIDAVAVKQEIINGMSIPTSNPTSSRGRPSISIDSAGRYQATPRQPYIKAEFPSATPLYGIAPATKASRPHFVMQPAGPPAQSVCASDASFWTPSSSSKGYSAAEREATIVAKIHSQIGERPLRPSRPGVNPFLIYTKEKWEECKAFCNGADSSTTTSPNKVSSTPATRDMIRQTIGKWWKAASEVDKRPYLDRSQAAQAQADLLRKQWDTDVAKWDADASRLRQEIIAEEQQPKPVQPAPVKAPVPAAIDVVATASAATVDDTTECGNAIIALAPPPPPANNDGAVESMVLS
jgi:lysine-specific histone demethylase 1